MKVCEYGRIVRNTEITGGIFDMEIETLISEHSKAGQFVMIYLNSKDHILPRPISICEINKPAGTIRLVYQAIGDGTKLLSKEITGSQIKLMGALGNGFDQSAAKPNSKIGVVGGGIGAPPLLQLTKDLVSAGHDVEVFLGFRTGSLLVEDFNKLGVSVHIATDDGSIGFKGNAVELLKSLPNRDMIYSCGPKIMLKNLSLYAIENGIDSQVSVEERMACGLGACVGCAIRINGQTLKVCKDGPVFNGSEVMWDE